MPDVRKSAAIGDWVVGIGSKSKWNNGQVVYAMHVGAAMPFEDYWQDPRFRPKRPNLRGSLKKAFGDNIYHRDPVTGLWRQMDSHHSQIDGKQNPANIEHDTRIDRVLISEDFVYWGGSGPLIPEFEGIRIRQEGRGHKASYPPEVVEEFIKWIRNLGVSGYCGDPLDWRNL